MNKASICLVHYPIYNKDNNVVGTSISNINLHDISRTVRTFGLDKFYIQTPFEKERERAAEIMAYWADGIGQEYNPDRKEAFGKIGIFLTMDEIISDAEAVHGEKPIVIATSARTYDFTNDKEITASFIRENLSDKPYIILFGTGFGMSTDFIKSCDFFLQPIAAKSDYNHLSVRSAVAIYLDRIFG